MSRSYQTETLTKDRYKFLGFYLRHEQDALPTPGRNIAQHQDLRKDDTIKGPGDSEVPTENARLCHSYKPHGAAVTRQIQEIQRMALDYYKDKKSANKIVILTAWAKNMLNAQEEGEFHWWAIGLSR